MQMTEARDQGVVVLGLAGRLDATSSPSVETRLIELLQANRALVLDLNGLIYISSAGLRIVLKGAKAAKSAGAQFALTELRPTVREVFEVSGFFTILKDYPSRAEAVASMAHPASTVP